MASGVLPMRVRAVPTQAEPGNAAGYAVLRCIEFTTRSTRRLLTQVAGASSFVLVVRELWSGVIV
jgi:hypothetical protein